MQTPTHRRSGPPLGRSQPADRATERLTDRQRLAAAVVEVAADLRRSEHAASVTCDASCAAVRLESAVEAARRCPRVLRLLSWSRQPNRHGVAGDHVARRVEGLSRRAASPAVQSHAEAVRRQRRRDRAEHARWPAASPRQRSKRIGRRSAGNAPHRALRPPPRSARARRARPRSTMAPDRSPARRESVRPPRASAARSDRGPRSAQRPSASWTCVCQMLNHCSAVVSRRRS